MQKLRFSFTPEQEAAILREHLLERVPVGVSLNGTQIMALFMNVRSSLGSEHLDLESERPHRQIGKG